MSATLRKLAAGGVGQIENAIRQLLTSHREGLRNVDIARELGLESYSSQRGDRRNGEHFLTHSILQAMVRENTVVKRGARYLLAD